MRQGSKFAYRGAFCHRGDDLVDEFAAGWPHTRAAQNLACARVGEQFDKAILRFHQQGFTVVVEGIAGCDELPALGACPRFGQTDARNLWLGENHADEEPIVHRARWACAEDRVRRRFAMLNGKVDDLVRPGAVSGGEDMRRGSAHLRVGGDAAGCVKCDTSGGQVEAGDVGRSAQAMEDLLRAHRVGSAGVFKADVFQTAFHLHVQQARAGEYLDAFSTEDVLHHYCYIGVEIAEQVAAALEQCHSHAEAREELREFYRHSPAAEHDKRLRQTLQSQRIVTGEKPGRVELRQRRRGYDGAGADDEVRAGEPLAIVQLDCVRVNEAGFGADKLEPPALQLLSPVAREVGDHRVFARHDFREVEADLRHMNSPGRRVLGEMFYLRRVEQRFRGHAAPQDAQAAYFPAALDDHRPQPAPSRRIGCRIARAAAADYHHIKIKLAWRNHVQKRCGSDGCNSTLEVS